MKNTLREQFESEVKSKTQGLSTLFETGNQYYIEWLENKIHEITNQ